MENTFQIKKYQGKPMKKYKKIMKKQKKGNKTIIKLIKMQCKLFV